MSGKWGSPPTSLNEYGYRSLFCTNGNKEVYCIDSRNGAALMLDEINNDLDDVDFMVESFDSKYIYVTKRAGRAFVKIDKSDNSLSYTGSSLIDSSCAGVAVSLDNTKLYCIRSSTPYLVVLDADTLVDIGALPTPITDRPRWIIVNPVNGDIVIATDDASNVIQAYDSNHNSIAVNDATLGINNSNSPSHLVVNDLGTEYYISFSNTVDKIDTFQSFDANYVATSTANNAINASSISTNGAHGLAVSPDSNLISLHTKEFHVNIFNIATDTRVSYFNNTEYYSGQLFQFLDNDNLAASTSTDIMSKIVMHTISAQANVKIGASAYNYNILLVINKKQRYEINCSINEVLNNDEWEAVAIQANKPLIAGSVEFTGSNFTIPVNTSVACTVVIRPANVTLWEKDKSYGVGDKIHPTNPTVTPYYFECSTAGISGTSEPVWNTSSASVTNDGSVNWVIVEGLIKPDANQPIIPTVA